MSVSLCKILQIYFNGIKLSFWILFIIKSHFAYFVNVYKGKLVQEMCSNINFCDFLCMYVYETYPYGNLLRKIKNFSNSCLNLNKEISVPVLFNYTGLQVCLIILKSNKKSFLSCWESSSLHKLIICWILY